MYRVIVVVRETVSVSITASGVKRGGTWMIMRATTKAVTAIVALVNGHEEVRAGGHEISGSVDVKIPDVRSLKTGGGRCRWSASLVEWVHALAGEGVGEAV